MVDPPEAMPLTKDDSTFLRSHQLLTAPWSGALAAYVLECWLSAYWNVGCLHARMSTVFMMECQLSTC